MPGDDHVALALLDGSHGIGVLRGFRIEVPPPVKHIAHFLTDTHQPLLDDEIIPGKHEIPIRYLRPRDHQHQITAKLLDIALLGTLGKVNRGGIDLLTEPAKQRLNETEPDCREIGRIR